MKIAQIFLLYIFIISSSLIACSKFKLANNIREEYIFNDFSNLTCNSDYKTTFIAKIWSDLAINSDQNFSFSFNDTNSLNHKVKCTINSNSKMRYLEQTDIEDNSDKESGESPDLPTKKNCYKTLCEFDEMVKENFTILINNDLEIKVDGLPENIYLTTYFYENITMKMSKCYLVKNTFKQVSKYRINSDDNKITFLFISSIKAKVEKNEKIQTDILLLKSGKTEKKNITCESQYTAEPLKTNEEILAFYDCEVPNIKNIGEFNGLIFNNSFDVEDIPKNSILNNPKITDELIKNGTINDYSVIVFDTKNIIFDNCEKNGLFYLNGKINGNLLALNGFGIILYLNNSDNYASAVCDVPSGYRQELNISCKTQINFFNSKINIPNIQILNNFNETLVQINEISKNELATCIINPIVLTTSIISTTTNLIMPTTEIITSAIETTEIKDEPIVMPGIITDVVFRQINNLEIDKVNKYITFNIIGFSFESNLEKDMKLSTSVNLINNDGNKKNKDLNCSLDNIINTSSESVYSLIFNCTIIYINDANDYIDIIITNSSSLINIPKEEPRLLSALNTDQLISQNGLKNYSEKNNLIEIPPILSSLSIIGDNCKDKGMFEINGVIDKSTDKNLSFYIKLDNQNINVRCKMPPAEANSEVNIICNTFENIHYEYIYINPKIIYDIDLNELFFINKVQSSNNIFCANNDHIMFQNALKKMESFVSFSVFITILSPSTASILEPTLSRALWAALVLPP